MRDASTRPGQEGRHAKETRIERASPRKQRYVRRDEQGRFTDDQVDVGRPLSADPRQAANKRAKKGEGDRGEEGSG